MTIGSFNDKMRTIMKTWKKLSAVLQAALIAFAVQMQYGAPLSRADYKSGMHYFYAQITGLLGEYSVNGLLIFLLALIFVGWMGQETRKDLYKKGVLPYLFSFCLLVGQSYRQGGSLSGCFRDIFSAAGFLLAFAGYSLLFHYCIALFLGLYQRAAVSGWHPGKAEAFLGEKSFRNVFLLLLILWVPVIVLGYPGNLCYDFLGQVEQGLGMTGYSTHHPLLHTLIAGGIIRLGRLLTGSADAGLFLYTLLQSAALAAALAGTAERLAKRGVSYPLRLAAVCVYGLAPVYSNIASTAIKDVPFMAAVIWYLLLLEELVTEGIGEKSIREEGIPKESARKEGIQGQVPGEKISGAGSRVWWGKLVLAQVLVGLLRNNGIYMVVLTGIILVIVYRKKILLLCTAVLPLVLCLGGNAALSAGLSAEKGSMGEMLSIPFQQTARYLQLYGDELSAEERKAIDGVLQDAGLVAASYNPDIADPVKALYLKDSGVEKLISYFKVWAAGFFKHPMVYLDAFFAHVYGWFDPGAVNSIRYEAESGLFRQGGLIPGMDKVLLFVYRFAGYVPFLAVLENVGVYTWLLLILAGAALRGKLKRGVLLAPLFISLLICMAAPCFYLHPRYAFPIMFTIPFLYGVMNGGIIDEGSTDKEKRISDNGDTDKKE